MPTVLDGPVSIPEASTSAEDCETTEDRETTPVDAGHRGRMSEGKAILTTLLLITLLAASYCLIKQWEAPSEPAVTLAALPAVPFSPIVCAGRRGTDSTLMARLAAAPFGLVAQSSCGLIDGKARNVHVSPT